MKHYIYGITLKITNHEKVFNYDNDNFIGCFYLLQQQQFKK